MDKDLKEDPRVLKLTEAFLDDWIARGLPASLRDQFRNDARNAVMGSAYSLWRYADTYLESGDVTLASVTDIADVTGMSVTVVTRMPERWLRVRPDGHVELPGYTEKNSLSTKDLRREQNKARQARFREKQRNARNAVTSRESNARNAPSRGRAHARAQAQPGPVPPNRDRSEETGSRMSADAELASAQGRLARRGKVQELKPNGHAKTDRELEADARKLHAAGMDSALIAKTLAQYGVEQHQVIAWISNEPAVAT